MPWLTDERCKQKYPTSNPTVHICAGETGGFKDTCQVKLRILINMMNKF